MIYFVQETGLLRNRVKIGFTENIKNRLADLRVANSSGLKVLLLLPGDTKTEMVYHEYFTKYSLHGEWFRYGLRLRLFVFASQFTPSALDKSNLDSHVVIPLPEDEIEQRVCDCYRRTGSYSKAFRLWYSLENGKDHKGSIGGNQRAKVKEILDHYDIPHPVLITALQETKTND